jgi:hypothetical protein
MTGNTKPSHGPLIAILAGMALVVVGLCGGAVYLLARGVRGMERMIEERRGPTEVVDDDYRVRVTAPTDGDPSWELWDRDLADEWDPDGIVVLRHQGCAAGIVVWPFSSERTLAEQLADFYGAASSTPRPAPAGATGEARSLTADDGASVVAFVHGGTLYRVVGDAACVTTLLAQLEILDANVHPRRLRPSIAARDARGYQVREDVFTSAASGLRVDASAPFSLELDDLARDYPGGEVVVLHENGTRVTLDPYRGLHPIEPSGGASGAAAFTVVLFGGEARFSAPDAEDPSFADAIAAPSAADGLGIRVAVSGVDRARMEEAVRALAPRVSVLSAEALAALRASLPAPADRRAGADWSLRDGVFREHPSSPRPRAVLEVPRFSDVLAGLELASREDQAEGRVVLVDRRDLGVAARLLVRPAQGGDAREELARVADGMPSTSRTREMQGDATRASVELAIDADTALAQRMHAELVVADGWVFELDAWWSTTEEHPDTAAYVEELARGLSVVGDPAELPSRQRHVDARLGFALTTDGAPIRELDATSEAEASSMVASTEPSAASITVVAVSAPMAGSTRVDALDLVGLDRSLSSLETRPPTPTLLDGRAAAVRTLGDLAFTTRVVQCRLDRTTYVVVLRSGRTADWEAELARVDLDL